MKRATLPVLTLLLFVLGSCRFDHSPKTRIIQYGPANGVDTYIQNSLRYHDWTWGKQPVLVSMIWTDDVNGSIQNNSRILIDFPELRQMPHQLIDSLKLTLYRVKDYAYILGGQYGNNANKVCCITENWDQNTANWDNQPAVDSSFSLTVPRNNQYDSVVIDLTRLLPGLLQYGHGIMIRQQNRMPWSSAVYGSSNNPDPANRPKLTVYYR
ncbi:MAG: DNRLRE domain-containing protein [Bacteroidales bacterium]|nr:DNRLRE domain-containing protein [Bacteroidales bacterium]